MSYRNAFLHGGITFALGLIGFLAAGYAGYHLTGLAAPFQPEMPTPTLFDGLWRLIVLLTMAMAGASVLAGCWVAVVFSMGEQHDRDAMARERTHGKPRP